MVTNMKLEASEISAVLATQVSETGEPDIGEGVSKIFQTSGISCHYLTQAMKFLQLQILILR